MNNQMGKLVLRKGLQTVLVALVMLFLTNMLTPLKAATWDIKLDQHKLEQLELGQHELLQEQQALSHSGWAMAATVGSSFTDQPLPLTQAMRPQGILDQVSSSIVLLFLVLFCCSGIVCISYTLKLSEPKVRHELR